MSKLGATKISRSLLNPGIKNLRSILQSELDVLRRTPLLLISSEAGASSPESKPVADSCQLVQFTLGQQLSVRTVPTTISSAFPTKDSLEQTLELMQRTGATSVVSVGSGAAMDLGKAVQDSLRSGVDEKNTPLIMIPTTYSGIVAAGASHSLFLDGDEETLVPFPQRHRDVLAASDGACSHATVSTIEPEKYMETLDANKFDVLLYAVSAIILDAGSRKSSHPSLPVLLQDAIDLISWRKNATSFDLSSKANDNDDPMALISSLINLLYQSASLFSYGLSDGFEEEDNRSITIALGSSLIPTLFPETHPISFIASLAPGICHYYNNQRQTQIADDKNSDTTDKLSELVDHLEEQFTHGKMRPPPSLIPSDESLKGFSVPDMALSYIQSNQAVWKTQDLPDDVLVHVLQHCLQQ